MPWLRGKLFSIPHGTLGETTTCSATHWNNGTLLFFGRVEEYKGLRYLIESVQLLKTEGFDVKVIIAGTGSDLTSYRDYLEANASFELIDRYIKKEEIPEIFARVDIVVMPYTDASQSGVAALALNYKCPVIATNVGSIGEMVRDGINGLLVPARDAQALADAIRSLLLDQAKLAKMSANAGHLAAGEFSWRSIGESTQKIYEAAIQHATRT
jgi:glycosyltransferase involved in cell wall biosynthesis